MGIGLERQVVLLNAVRVLFVPINITDQDEEEKAIKQELTSKEYRLDD